MSQDDSSECDDDSDEEGEESNKKKGKLDSVTIHNLLKFAKVSQF